MKIKKKVQIIINFESEQNYMDILEDIERIAHTKIPHTWEITDVSLDIGQHVTIKPDMTEIRRNVRDHQ